ncbi:hypothetical protein JD969_17240 [Planctomycetota bacterium]|nr:hypothetical protein JD969_17240 [Planctomycetota bacterium]
MTSKQFMLIIVTLLTLTTLTGCSLFESKKTDPMDPISTGIYPRRQLWAVVPLRNESGTALVVDKGARIADTLAAQLETQPGIDVIPVNRVLAAMESLQITQITTPAEALTLRHVLEVDALVVGSITAYNAYDPPKLGIGVELYVNDKLPWFNGVGDLSVLQQSATDKLSHPIGSTASTYAQPQGVRQPLTVAVGYFDAGDPGTQDLLKLYASGRGVNQKDKYAWRLWRINMDLYTEFVANIVSDRLMKLEVKRLQESQPKPTESSKDEYNLDPEFF